MRPHDHITTHPEYRRVYDHYVQTAPADAARLAYEHTARYLSAQSALHQSGKRMSGGVIALLAAGGMVALFGLGATVAAVVGGSGSSGRSSRAITVTATSPGERAASPTPAAPKPAAPKPAVPKPSVPKPAPPAPAPQTFEMPNLVGAVLQDAQDRMQAVVENPAFVSSSVDATGQGRAQILDANWKVCTQTPKPGTKITLESSVVFGAVKVEERCP